MRPTEATKDICRCLSIAKLTHLGQKLCMLVYPAEDRDGNEDKEEAE